MSKKEPRPRVVNCYGQDHHPTLGERGTWIEAEGAAYRSGGKNRRCYAVDAETNELRVVLCGIPDTYFSIPCRGGGYVTLKDGVFIYNPPKDKA